ncbi:hypothetical protein GCM10027419_36850 [Pandoraea terrae]
MTSADACGRGAAALAGVPGTLDAASGDVAATAAGIIADEDEDLSPQAASSTAVNAAASAAPHGVRNGKWLIVRHP